ncbi:MAG: hypothetical protein ACLU6W_09980 [Lachnospiraceae bacterium]
MGGRSDTGRNHKRYSEDKDCGMNFIRGSHYPHHPFFAEECDRSVYSLVRTLFLGNWGLTGGYWTSSAYPVREEDREAF